MNNVAVLFVDDERNVLSSIERAMLREPYQKHYATSGRDALKILESESVAVIATDMKMPEMDGLTLLRQVRERFPETVRLVISAYTAAPQLLAVINSGEVFRYITKPIGDLDEFRATLRAAITQHLLGREKRALIAELHKQNADLAAALAQVKKLEGLLPICSYCKKIRDDHNYWQDVEFYIASRTAARFSHGICPECMQNVVAPMLQKMDPDGAAGSSGT